MRQPEIFIEQDDQRDGLRPQMRAGGAERVGRLARVASLDAAAAIAAFADMHGEAPHVRAHDRPLFLNLCGHAGFAEAAPARGAGGRQWHVDRFVDRRRRNTMRVSAVMSPGTTTAWPWRWRRRTLRKRGGLTLAGCRAASNSFFRRSFSRSNRVGFLRFLQLGPQSINFSIRIGQARRLARLRPPLVVL